MGWAGSDYAGARETRGSASARETGAPPHIVTETEAVAGHYP